MLESSQSRRPHRRNRDTKITQTYLLARPQRTGFLPTQWFWNDKNNWRLVRVPVAVVMALLVVVIGILRPSLYVAALVPVVVYAVMLGLFERYVR